MHTLKYTVYVVGDYNPYIAAWFTMCLKHLKDTKYLSI